MSENGPKFLLDPYLEWADREGAPIHEGACVDLRAAATGPWPRLGADCAGAFVHLEGRGDYLTAFVIEIAPGGSTAPLRHVCDIVYYVLAGHGEMVVEGGAARLALPCGPGALLAPPLNAAHHVINASRDAPVRLAAVTDLRLLMNIYHNDGFIFANPLNFPERGDVVCFNALASRAGEIPLGESSLRAIIHGIAAVAQRQRSAGHHVIVIEGAGHTLLWREGEGPPQRIDWRAGHCFALPSDMFHQHISEGAAPARVLTIGFGNSGYPIVAGEAPEA